jgi:hypothetical protein
VSKILVEVVGPPTDSECVSRHGLIRCV